MNKVKPLQGPPARDFSGTMTDLCFLLIVFFLIAAAFVSDTGLPLVLPEPDAKPQELRPDQALRVGIKSDGSLEVDTVLVPRNQLASLLKARFELKPDLVLLVEPASDVRYEHVLSLLETARQSGARTFSINTADNEVPIEVQKP